MAEGRGGLGQRPDPRFSVQHVLLLLLLVRAVARLRSLLPVRVELVPVRFATTFAQVLFSPERDGDFHGPVLDEVLGRAVAGRGHVRVHVVAVLQLALGALGLQRVELLQVAELELLVPALWEGKGNGEETVSEGPDDIYLIQGQLRIINVKKKEKDQKARNTLRPLQCLVYNPFITANY